MIRKLFIHIRQLTMPTLATQPSLQSTQLVGAVLMHQFFKDRFTEAGISEELIREAEEKENLNHLVCSTINENEADDTTTTNTSSFSDISATENSVINSTSNLSKVSTTIINDSQTEQDVTTNSNNRSTRDDISNAQYHSIAESINCNDNTLYHSINGGGGDPEPDAHPGAINLETLQSSPAMKYYGRQLRLLAEEFEKDRKRLIVKDHANKVSISISYFFHR